MMPKNLPFKDPTPNRGQVRPLPVYDYPALATLRVEERYLSMVKGMTGLDGNKLEAAMERAFPVPRGNRRGDSLRYVKHFYALIPALIPGSKEEFEQLKRGMIGLLQSQPFPNGECPLTGMRLACPFASRDYSNLTLAGVTLPDWRIERKGSTLSHTIDAPVYVAGLIDIMSPESLRMYSNALGLEKKPISEVGTVVLSAAAQFTVKHGFIAVCGFPNRLEVGLGADQLSKLGLHPIFDNQRDVLVLMKL